MAGQKDKGKRKGKGKGRIRLSKLYSFVACGRSSLPDDQARIGEPGYSRIVYANDPDCPEAFALNYVDNSTSTTKYTLFTFLPKNLFEQFRRVANFYFLVTAILSYTMLSPYDGSTAVLPLAIVIGATMVKEAIEDWRRKKQDTDVNNRKVKVCRVGGTFEETEWKNLRVGDIVKVEKDHFFPADLVLLSSSYEDAVCYVETMNLDGETNLKLKQALDVTSSLQEDGFHDFRAIIKCEDPNAHLYTFVGNIEIDERQYPLAPQQVLLRDSKLRNTDYIYGAVIFTGHDTKVMQNATKPPSKRSKIERRMDKIVYFLLLLLVVLSFITAIFFGVWTRGEMQNGQMVTWYLLPTSSNILYDPNKAALSAFLQFFTAMMLYGYFIPISLYVTIEVVKIWQASFINQDIQMYDEKSDKPTHARTSNLNEELGQVDTILSDKTGTLTCNSMEFIKCSIAGTAYGRGVTEVERAMAKRKGTTVANDLENGSIENAQAERKPRIKGFNFSDDRIMNGNWIHQPHADVIEKFLRLLSVCHTCIPDVDEESGKVSYEAESPDEAAFVVAARELRFEFYQRAQTTVSVHEFDPSSGRLTDRSYKLLHILEFSSARKRMSVIVKDEEGILLLLSKGADSVMFERMSKEPCEYLEATKEHIDEYANAGLRTLVLAYRQLDAKEVENFDKKFTAAKNSVSIDRDKQIEELADMIERDLILLGATAVEDKLQKGVPECIDKLAQAGIKIWVLTGDKMETAINIGYACSLLRQGMKQITITLDSPEIIAVEKSGNKVEVAKESKNSVVHQINEGIRLTNSMPNEAFALIIDGKSLTYALEDDVKGDFLRLAIVCGSVICCRSSPKQKAMVTRLVKTGTGKVTLAIGDGANDVGMLQEADIGVGISGAEGMQAVMASDISIAQFRFLERLLLVHGHWCYRRISSMICYFFYKNLAFGSTLVLYEVYSFFSGEAAYNDWNLSLYNVFFTSLPVGALGILDQDVSAEFCLKYPMLYQEGPQNLLFRWTRILGSIINGTIQAIIIFYMVVGAQSYQAFRSGGEVIDYETIGTTMCTVIIWVVNIQLAITSSYLTRIHHGLIWGSIGFWYFYLVVYGYTSPSFSTTAYQVFTEELAPAWSFWFVTLLVTLATLLPHFCYSIIKKWFFPSYHDKIQMIEVMGVAEDDPETGAMLRRQLSVRPTTVGVSARREAIFLQPKRKVHNSDTGRTP